ncbi:MAG: hypothetical protein M0R03_17335 [Novosphingobium sp.]|nr:hypothetical protein [Novosphingobium sp.]
MSKSTREQRRERLRNRTKSSVENRDKKGLGRSSVIDLSKIPASIGQYAMKTGRNNNIIDILPFMITQDWYKNLRTVNGNPTGLEIGDIDYKLEIPIHKNVGPDNKVVLCPNKAFGLKCPICEQLKEEYDKDEKSRDKKKIDALKVSWRNFYNLYDYEEEDEDKAYKVWLNESFHLFEKFLLKDVEEEEAAKGETITFADCEDGRTLSFKGKEKSMNKDGSNPYGEAESISFESRDPWNEDEVLKRTVSFDALLVRLSYDEIQEIFLGIDSDDSSDDRGKAQEDDTPVTRGRSRSRQQEEKSKEDEPPETGRGRGRGKKEPEPEETIEDDIPFDSTECPFGHKFGKDCNEHPECSDDKKGCPQETFEACSEEQDRLARNPEPEEPKGRSRKPAEEKKEDTAPSRGRSRESVKPKDEPVDAGHRRRRG